MNTLFNKIDNVLSSMGFDRNEILTIDNYISDSKLKVGKYTHWLDKPREFILKILKPSPDTKFIIFFFKKTYLLEYRISRYGGDLINRTKELYQ